MAGDFATVPIRKESRRAAISSLSISCRFLRMSILDMVPSYNKSIITLVILTETTLPVKTFFCYVANLRKISYKRTKLLQGSKERTRGQALTEDNGEGRNADKIAP